jgi:hypothetical protein
MSENLNIKLECLKVAATLVSSTVYDRAVEVANVTETLYTKLFCDNIPDNSDTPVRKKPGRPRGQTQQSGTSDEGTPRNIPPFLRE